MRQFLQLLVTLLTVSLIAAACGSADDSSNDAASDDTASEFAVVTEDNLPEGFSADPSFTEPNGTKRQFVNIPGHYWKVIDDRGFAIGLHFQTDVPFPWAKDVAKGELLYIINAIPGTCGDGNYAEAIKSPNATIAGPLLPGFDHWHGYVDGGSTDGSWYEHIAVRDFEFAGPPENPFEGKQINAGTPGFLPVCDVT